MQDISMIIAIGVAITLIANAVQRFIDGKIFRAFITSSAAKVTTMLNKEIPIWLRRLLFLCIEVGAYCFLVSQLHPLLASEEPLTRWDAAAIAFWMCMLILLFTHMTLRRERKRNMRPKN